MAGDAAHLGNGFPIKRYTPPFTFCFYVTLTAEAVCNCTGERNFACMFCTKKFMRSDHLSKHLATHM